MKILLLCGSSVEIDDEDYQFVGGLRWIKHTPGRSNTSYASCKVKVDGRVKIVLMHRLILGLTERSVVTDHINGNGLDNRRCNLRAASHAENMRNSRLRSHSTSGVKGVMFEKRYSGDSERGWRGSVRFEGKRYRKWFDSKDAAEKWCIETRKRLHGEFAFDARQDEQQPTIG